MDTKGSKKLLKLALMGNAVFSAATGSICIAASQHLAELFGIGQPIILTAIGASLIPFALFVLMVARRNYPVRWEVYAVCAMDFIWVLSVSAMLGFDFYQLTTVGIWSVSIVSVLVFDFLMLQLYGLYKAKELTV